MPDLASKSASLSATEATHKKVDFNTALIKLPVPAYLQKNYWWAYVDPRAVRIFERGWLINLILFGNYAKLRNAALEEIGQPTRGRTLQVACVYGDLTPRLSQRHTGNATLDVIDVLPIQLQNLQHKLTPGSDVSLFQRDSAALGFADGSYDRVLIFFLLHEQPESVRRGTLAEAFRVVKPGGKIVIVDYHRRGKWNLLRYPLQALLRRLEPFADDLWQHDLAFYFPKNIQPSNLRKQTFFGGLYQKIVLTR
ncbi:MAG: class I SAM-dependent methyltransferase [Glaciimonas sp.]|nr:class I SAM-dependent methyltransferase [Glaciimonas sp.]